MTPNLKTQLPNIHALENIRITQGTVELELSEINGAAVTLLMVLVALYSVDNGTIILDEPDLSMHPVMINGLRRLLYEENMAVPNTRHLLTITHSREMLYGVPPQSIYHFHQDAACQAVVHNLGQSFNLDNSRIILDPISQDIFFAHRILFVEGISDYQLIHILINTINKSSELQSELKSKCMPFLTSCAVFILFSDKTDFNAMRWSVIQTSSCTNFDPILLAYH